MYALYRDGATLAEVGAHFGISGPRVSALFTEAGLQTRGPGRGSLTPSEAARRAEAKLARTRNRERIARERERARVARAREMHAMYVQGHTLAEVGRHFALTRERVRQLLAATDLPKRRKGELSAVRRARHLARGAEIVEAYEQLGTVTAVSLELGVPRNVVSEIVRRERPSRPPRQHRFRYSDDELLSRLRDAAELNGGYITVAAYERVRRDARRPQQWPVPETYVGRFGLWVSALSAAGLWTVRASGGRKPRYSGEACLTALRRAFDELGENPTMREYDKWARRHEDVPCAVTVARRCAGWTAAVRRAAGSARLSAGGSSRNVPFAEEPRSGREVAGQPLG